MNAEAGTSHERCCKHFTAGFGETPQTCSRHAAHSGHSWKRDLKEDWMHSKANIPQKHADKYPEPITRTAAGKPAKSPLFKVSVCQKMIANFQDLTSKGDFLFVYVCVFSTLFL